METLVQIYTAESKEKLQKLNRDFKEAFRGGSDQIVVTDVQPFYNFPDDKSKKLAGYWFKIYFDSVSFDHSIEGNCAVLRSL